MSKTALAIVAVLLGIVVLVALLQGSTDYIGSGTLSAQAGIANPAATMQVNSVGGWLLKAAGIGVILLALVAAVFFGVGLLRKSGGRWQSGPNARWKRKDPEVLAAEKQPSLVELMMLSMLRGQASGSPLPLNAPRRDDDDNDPMEF